MFANFLSNLERLSASSIPVVPETEQLQRWFRIFIVAHLVVWFFITLLLRHNAPMDAIEGIVWGHQWQLGYDKHPFLAPWISAAVTNLLGSNDWPIYLLSQLCVITCFWAVWQLGIRIFSPLYALMAVMLLEGVLYYNALAVSVDPDMLMLPLWSLTILYFYDAIKQQLIADWILVGVLAGLAMLTKYESGLLLLALSSLFVLTPEGRKSFFKPGVYLALLLFIVTFIPNVVWLAKHQFIAINYALGRATNHGGLLNHFIHPVAFSLEQLGMILAMLLMALPFYCSQRYQTLAVDKFKQVFLLAAGLGPIVIALTISLLTGFQLLAGWGYPLCSCFGLLLLLWLKPVIDVTVLRRFLSLFLLIISLILTVKIIDTKLLPYVTHSASSALFPGSEIAKPLTAQWHSAYQRPLLYVAGERRLVAYVAAYSKDQPVPYFGWDLMHNAWINEKKVEQAGALFVWPAGDATQSILPSEIAQRFPAAVPQPIQEFSYLSGAPIKPFRVASAYLPPQELANIKLIW